MKKSSGTGSTLTDGLCDDFNFQGRYEPICARDLPEGDFDVVFFCGGYNACLLNELLANRLKGDEPGALGTFQAGQPVGD